MAVTEERLGKERAESGDGRILSVAGPVIQVEFPPGKMPEIGYALQVERTLEGHTDVITAEVAQHVGESTIKAICMRPIDGLVRGAKVLNTGAPISVPVGPET